VVGINLPDTVIYYKGSPIVWYQTQNSCVVKMPKEKLSVAQIVEKFQEPLCQLSLSKQASSQTSSLQPVAYFIQFVSEHPGEPTKGVKYLIKYLLKQDLSSLGITARGFHRVTADL
jgi:hypothetical protein